MMFLGKERRQRPAAVLLRGIHALNLSAVRLRPIYIPHPSRRTVKTS